MFSPGLQVRSWLTGRRSTIVVDVLGNQIGWVHGNRECYPADNGEVPANCTNCTMIVAVRRGEGLVSDGELMVKFGSRL